ncbi:hypothetical protein LTR37_010249 [Vermiconidia calcicola]|uniref:Uncharacterized protein n=1 Tax=Vermiconidia calcicola TaxID=1690605 RepID=A0ACC3N5R6_9PEZI|nr:hypothetical protein LTR37_010249 [Vermiconidia calcicola]
MSTTKPTQPQFQSIDTDDAHAPKFAASALDFLLIELVPLAQRITEKVQARDQALIDEYRRSKLFNGSNNGTTPEDVKAAKNTEEAVKKKPKKGAKPENTEPTTTLGFPPTTPQTREAMFWRLDSLGYRVGQGLVERFSTGKPRPQTPLDAIKFICKDLWTLVFRKQIDNLKTNHRGIFVLTDNRFQALSRMSVDRRAGKEVVEEGLLRAGMYLYFPSGVIRGALAGLGIEATVTGETAEIPTATFQIKTKGAKA